MIEDCLNHKIAQHDWILTAARTVGDLWQKTKDKEKDKWFSELFWSLFLQLNLANQDNTISSILLRCFVFPMEIVCHDSTILVESSRKFSSEPISPPPDPSVCILLLVKTYSLASFWWHFSIQPNHACMQFAICWDKSGRSFGDFCLCKCNVAVGGDFQTFTGVKTFLFSFHLFKSFGQVEEKGLRSGSTKQFSKASPLLQTLIAFL